MTDHLYIALELPYTDGSGHPTILGAYDTETAAEARCWRRIREQGHAQPSTVIEVTLNVDTEQRGDT